MLPRGMTKNELVVETLKSALHMATEQLQDSVADGTLDWVDVLEGLNAVNLDFETKLLVINKQMWSGDDSEYVWSDNASMYRHSKGCGALVQDIKDHMKVCTYG